MHRESKVKGMPQNQERGSTVVQNAGRGSTVVEPRMRDGRETGANWQEDDRMNGEQNYEGESYYGESEETITEIVGEDIVELESENDVEDQI